MTSRTDTATLAGESKQRRCGGFSARAATALYHRANGRERLCREASALSAEFCGAEKGRSDGNSTGAVGKDHADKGVD